MATGSITLVKDMFLDDGKAWVNDFEVEINQSRTMRRHDPVDLVVSFDIGSIFV